MPIARVAALFVICAGLSACVAGGRDGRWSPDASFQGNGPFVRPHAYSRDSTPHLYSQSWPSWQRRSDRRSQHGNWRDGNAYDHRRRF